MMQIAKIIPLMLMISVTMAVTRDHVTEIPIGIVQSDGAFFGPQAAQFALTYLHGYQYYQDYRNEPFEANGHQYKLQLNIREFVDTFDPNIPGFSPTEMLGQMQDLYDAGTRAFIITIFSPFYSQAVQAWAEVQPEIPLIIDPSGAGLAAAKNKDYYFLGGQAITNLPLSSMDPLAIAGAKTISFIYSYEDPGLKLECDNGYASAASRGITPTAQPHLLPLHPFLDGQQATFDYAVELLTNITTQENPDILCICAYVVSSNTTMAALKAINWMPKGLMLVPGFVPQDTYSLDNAEFAILSDSWNAKLNYPGDQIFGTPGQFAGNYTERVGVPPDGVDAVSVHMPYTLELGYQKAINFFDLEGLPTSDQLIFSYARLNNPTYFANIKFGVDGDFDAPAVAIQLIGENQYTDSGIFAPKILRGSKRIDDYPVSKRIDDYPISKRIDDYPVSKRIDDYPVSKRIDDYPISKRIDDYPISKQFNDYPISKRIDDYPISKRIDDYPVSKRIDDYPISKRIDDYSVSERIDDYPISKRIDDYPISKRIDDYPVSKQFNDYFLSYTHMCMTQRQVSRQINVNDFPPPYEGRQVIAPLDARGTDAIVVYPAPTFEERNEDLGWYKNNGEIAYAVLTSVVIVFFIIPMAVVTYLFKDRDPIKYASPPLMYAVLFSCTMMISVLYVWQLYETDAACAIIPWLLGVGFAALMSILFFKSLRVYNIVRASKQLKQIRVNLSTVVVFIVITISVQIIWCIIITALDTIQAVKHIPDIYRPINNYVECSIEDDVGEVFIYILIGYSAFLLLANIVMAFFVWSTVGSIPVMNEAPFISLSLLAICFGGIIVLGLQVSGAVDRDTLYYIRSLVIWGTVTITIAFLYFGRLWEVYKGRDIRFTAGETIGTTAGVRVGSSSGNQVAMTSASASQHSANGSAV